MEGITEVSGSVLMVKTNVLRRKMEGLHDLGSSVFPWPPGALVSRQGEFWEFIFAMRQPGITRCSHIHPPGLTCGRWTHSTSPESFLDQIHPFLKVLIKETNPVLYQFL